MGCIALAGSDMPQLSAIEVCVDAVPIVLQCPADGALSHARSRNSSSLISHAASLRRERQMTVPEPTSSPSCQPSSIGPPASQIAGMSTLAAAMLAAGLVLSYPVVRTPAESGTSEERRLGTEGGNEWS